MSTVNHRSLASDLPVEVLDSIFVQHFGDAPLLASVQSGKAFALVCRRWRSPVQRYLLRIVVINSAARMKELMTSRVTDFIRDLRIDVAEGGQRWKVKRLVALLKKVSRLHRLELQLNERSPGVNASFRAITSVRLSSLQHLHLEAIEYDRNLKAFQNILAATPNIKSLAIGCAPSEPATLGYSPPNLGAIVPLAFPSLASLKLIGEAFCLRLCRIGLFTAPTLLQITDLALGKCWADTHLGAQPDVGSIEGLREQVKTLSFQDYGTSEIANNVLAALDQVTTVSSVHAFTPSSELPSTVTTFRYLEGCDSYECTDHAVTTVLTSFLKSIEIEASLQFDEEMAANLRDTFEIEITVNGVCFAPPAALT